MGGDGRGLVDVTRREELTMSAGITTIIYPVRDLAKAKQLFTEVLGTPPSFDQPYYVGWNVDGQDIGLDPHGHSKGMTGPLPYVQVKDIKSTLQALLDAGAEPHQDVRNVGGGRLIAAVKDPDGNVVGLIQPE
jgi:predicted enzyme related to lactoylglutathione lyase